MQGRGDARYIHSRLAEHDEAEPAEVPERHRERLRPECEFVQSRGVRAMRSATAGDGARRGRTGVWRPYVAIDPRSLRNIGGTSMRPLPPLTMTTADNIAAWSNFHHTVV